jgi:pyruvate dehydrogenase E2 component (dihydrolipoamide acetyltransferase)
MATAIQLPALSPTMKEGKILKWLKAEGDKVSSGEAIAEVETDKSNLEVETYDDGVLLKILVPAGESAAVGAPIAFIGAKGETVDVAALAAAVKPAPALAAAPVPAPAAPPPAPPASAARAAPPAPAQVLPLRRPEAAPAGDGRLRASPLAKRMAQEAGVDLGSVQGSGPQGRIVKRDVQAAMSAPATARAPVFVPGVRTEPEVLALTTMRKVIAQRMA